MSDSIYVSGFGAIAAKRVNTWGFPGSEFQIPPEL